MEASKIQRRKKPQFLRKDWHKCIRLRNGLKWRRSRGRHAKVRQKWKSRQKMPSIGYGMPREIRGKINGMIPVMVNNVQDLKKIGKGEIGILSRKVGRRKRIDVAKNAIEMKVEFSNFNARKFLEQNGKGQNKKEEPKNVKTETPKVAAKTGKEAGAGK